MFMARPDRLFQLLQAMRALPKPVTAARLAMETGVSQRSVYRDIETLRGAGARIEGAAGFGYTLTEDPGLPPQSFTRTEIEALVLGLAEVRHLGDGDLGRAAEAALAKIVATLPERLQRQAIHAVVQSYRFHPRAEPRVDMALLRRASWEEDALDLVYLDKAGDETRRRILPLSLVFLDRAPMLLAWCELRQGFRRFVIDRMVSVAATGESVRPRRVPLLRAFLAEMRGEAGNTSSR